MTTGNENPGAAWKEVTDAMHAQAAGVDWSKVDWSKLAPSDIGVQMGPMMTEEQFREYQRRKGVDRVHVIRGADKK